MASFAEIQSQMLENVMAQEENTEALNDNTAAMGGAAGPAGASGDVAQLGLAMAAMGNHSEGLQGRLSDLGMNMAMYGGQLGPVAMASNVLAKGMGRVVTAVGGLTAAIGAASFFSDIFKGGLVDEAQYIKGIREVAYVTAGITSETETLQREWQDFGKTVRITGKNVTEFQKQYIANLQKGYKTQQDTIDVTKQGLHLSYMLGSSTESTADLMFEFHMQLNRSTTEVGQIAQGMQEVARNTGIMGDAMVDVVKSSMQFLKNMRNAGTLSAESTKNVVALVAEARKLGVEEGAGKWVEGLSSMHGWLHKTSGGMKAMMMAGAQLGAQYSDNFSGAQLQSQVMHGQILKNKEGMKALAKGSEDYLLSIIRGFGVDMPELTQEAVEGMSPEIQQRVDLVFKGMGLEGGLAGSVLELEAMKRAGMDFTDQADELQKALASGTLTTQEYINKEKQLFSMRTAKEIELSGVVLSATKKAGGGIDAFKNSLSTALADPKYARDLQKLQLDQLSGADQVRKVLEYSAEDINKRLKDAGADMSMAIKPKMIEEALKDPKQYELLTKSMQEAQDAAETAEKAALDPISQVEQWTNQLNENFREYSRGALTWYMKIFGAIGSLALVVSTGFAGLIVSMTSLAAMMNSAFMAKTFGGPLATSLKDSFGKFGGKVTGGLNKVWEKTGAKFGTGLSGLGDKLRGDFVNTRSGATTIGEGFGMDAPKWMGKKWGAMFTSLTGKVGAGLQTLGGKLTGIASGGPAAAAGLGVLIAAVATVGAAITGVISAFKAGAKAAEIFQVAQDEVTISQKLAAENAGFITGVFNFLTFGVFRKYLGPTGTWTTAIARFIDALGPLKYLIPGILLLDVLMLTFKVIWGVLKGLYLFIKNIFIGIWEGIKSAIEPIIEVWNYFREVLAKVLEPFSGAGKSLHELGGVVGIISKTFGFLGKAIGFVFQILGKLIGFILNIFVPVFKVLIDIFGYVGSAVVAVLQPLWIAFQAIFSTIQSILSWFGVGPKEPPTRELAGPSGEATTEEEKFYEQGTTKGSIFVHDIYAEKLLLAILKQLSGGSAAGEAAMASAAEKEAGAGAAAAGGGGFVGGAGEAAASDMMGTAANIITITLGVGAIVAALVPMAIALTAMVALAPLIPLAISGALILTALAGVVLGVATAIVFMGQLLSKLTGGVSGAIKTAIGVAALLAAAGYISLVVLNASPYIIAMNAVAPFLPAIYSGGLVLLALSGIILGLATAIVLMGGLASLITGGVGGAVKIAIGVAALIGAAGLIALMVLNASPYLIMMNLLWPVIPLIYQGSLVLLAMSGIVLGLALAIVAMGAIAALITGGIKGAITTAINVAGLIGAAGLIAVMVLASSGQLALLPALWPLIPLIYQGSLVLLALSGIVMGLALAIVLMGKMASSITGGIKGAIQTAINVAGLIGAAGLIALMVLASAGQIALMPALWPLMPAILLGSLALLALSAVILGLATAIVLMGQIAASITGGMKGAIQTAINVAGLIGAAGLIAVMTLAAAPLLASMAGLILLVPLVWIGGIALMALAGAVIAMTTGLIAISRGIMAAGGVDAKEAASVAEDVAALIKAAGDIAWNCLWAAPKIILMGLLLPLIPYIWFGGMVLLALTGAIVTLTTGIIAIARGIMATAGVDAETAAATAEGVAAVLEAAGSITWSLLKMAPLLAGMALLYPIAGFIASAMLTGAIVLVMLTAPVALFAAAMVSIGKMLVSLIPEDGADALIQGIHAIEEIVGSVINIMLTMKEKVGPLLSKKFVFFGPTELESLAGLSSVISDSFGAIYLMVGDIIKKMQGSEDQAGIKMEDMTETKDKLNQIAGIFDALGEMMQTMKEKIKPLVSHWPGFDSEIENLAELTPEFSKHFPTIVRFVAEGLINPIQDNIKYVKEGDAGTLEKMNLINGVLKGVTPMLDMLTTSVMPLLKGGWFSDAPIDTILKRKDDIQELFKSISVLIMEGFVKPLREYEFREEGTLDKLKQIPDIIKAIPPVVNSINEELKTLVEGWWSSDLEDAASVDFTGFAKVLRNVNEQILKPVQENIKGGADAAKDIKGIKDLVTNLPQIMDTINEVIPKVSGIKGFNIDEAAISGMKQLAELLGALREAAENVPSPESLDKLVRFLPRLPGHLDNIQAGLMKGASGARGAMGDLGPAGGGAPQVAIPLARAEAAAAVLEPGITAQPTSMADVGDKLQQKYAEVADAGRSVGGDTAAAELAAQTVLLTQAVFYLKQMATDEQAGATPSLGGADTETISSPPQSKLATGWPGGYNKNSNVSSREGRL